MFFHSKKLFFFTKNNAKGKLIFNVEKPKRIKVKIKKGVKQNKVKLNQKTYQKKENKKKLNKKKEKTMKLKTNVKRKKN